MINTPTVPQREPSARQPYVPVMRAPVNDRLVRLIPEDLARSRRAVPLGRQGDALAVAMANPDDAETVAEITRLVAFEIKPVLSGAGEINILLDQVYGVSGPSGLWHALSHAALATGFLTDHQVADIEAHNRTGLATGEEGGPSAEGVTEEDLAELLSLTLYQPRLSLDCYHPRASLVDLLPREYVRAEDVLPIMVVGGRLVVAAARLLPSRVLETIEQTVGFEPVTVLTEPSALRRAIDQASEHTSRNAVARATVGPPLRPLWRQLLADGFVNRDQVGAAETVARRTGEPIEDVLRRLGDVTEPDLLHSSAAIRNTEFVSLEREPIDRSVAHWLPESMARRHRCLPLRQDGQRVVVALADFNDDNTPALLESVFGHQVRCVLCTQADLEAAFARIYVEADSSAAGERPPLSEYLVRSGLLSRDQVAEGLRRQRETRQPLGRCLLDLHLLNEDRLAELLSLQLQMPWVNAARYAVPAHVVRLLPEDIARQYKAIPLYQEGQLLTVATSNPQDPQALLAVREHTGLDVRLVLAAESEVQAAIDRLYYIDLSSISPEAQEFGEHLTHAGLMRREQLLEVWNRQLQGGLRFDEAMVSLGVLTDEGFADAVAAYTGLARVDLHYRRVPVEVIDGLGLPRQVLRWVEPLDIVTARLLPEEMARRYSAVPIASDASSITVAFVNPVEQEGQDAIRQSLPSPVKVVIATRSQLDEAIRRVYNRRMLGDILVEADLITRRQLESGIELHRRTGVRLGKALISLAYVTQDQITTCLAEQQGLPYFNLRGVEISEEVARSIPEAMARSNGVLPIAKEGNTITLAMVDPMDSGIIEQVEKITESQVMAVITTEGDLEDALERIYSGDYLWTSANDLVFRYPEESAVRVLTRPQKIFFLGFLAISLFLLIIAPVGYLTVLVAISTVFYVSFSAYKFYLIYKALSHSLEIPITAEDLANLDDRDLPVYTVLVPVYREAEVIPVLVRAIDNLDYPKTKLDVQILLEEDDKETIAAVRRIQLPAHFHPVIVPNSLPKGKPKACNYGLLHAQGELLVIYDAEDIPERDQLKKVVVAFRKAPRNVECIQAKLNYYNRDQNLLTRWFTTEYSMWFDLFIPGLDASNSPIPLGGTSNHFRTARLRELGAWDPYNVTEDADLGVRLFKHGWKTAVIDSTTYEEANSQLYNWLRQRSRWVKGYIHTYLVHMRHPLQLLREIGPYQFFSFNMVVGGTFFGFLMNPVYWLLTAAWYTTRFSLIEQLFPGPIYYIGALGLYVGNFAFMYTNVAGCMRRQYYDMVKYALLSPLYWALMSIGAWKGFLQLFYRASYWEKTVHGLYRGEVNLRMQVDGTANADTSADADEPAPATES